MNTKHLSLIGSLDFSLIEKTSEWIQDLGKEFNFSHTDMYRIELCLAELVTNVVSYSAQKYSNQPVEIQAEINGKKIVLTLIDPADPFNPLSLPSPPIAKSLEDMQVGGQGVHLVKEFSDDIRYERQNNKNSLKLVFNLERPKAEVAK